MRRVVASGLLAPVCAGAVVAVLAAAHAFGQPVTRQPGGLRPAFEDTDDTARREAPRPAVRRGDTRPVGTLPNFDNQDLSQPQSYGNPPGYGAAKTGFVSTNKRRPALRKGVRPPLSVRALSLRAIVTVASIKSQAVVISPSR